MAELICVGLNHKTASVEIREQAALSQQQQDYLLRQTASNQISNIHELVVLSTCNRTELYAVADNASVAGMIQHLLVESGQLDMVDGLSFTYALMGKDCIEHLMRVAAGLDSQVVGEPQILGQLTDAYEKASELEATGAVLSTLMQYAIHAGKRVRHETVLGEGALSISAVAAMHSKEVFGDLERACVLVIGAGEMARTAAGAFVRRGVDKLLITNRTLEHADELARQWDGQAVPFTQLGPALVEADLVISAAYSPHPLLYVDDITPILEQRNNRPLIIFDIAMPRTVEPEVNNLPNVRLYNLDHLQAVSEAHYTRRQSAIPQAEQIINEEMQLFNDWLSSRTIVPIIQQLRSKADTIRQSELDHMLRRLPALSDHEKQVITEFSQRLVNKLLHDPTLQLKKQSAEQTTGVSTDVYRAVMADLFKLNGSER